MLLILTGALQVDHPEYMEKEYNFRYPNDRLSKFCDVNNIRYFDTYPFVLEKKQMLAPPYFSWKYDGHYSTVGTEFISDLLAEYLYNTFIK